MAVSTSERYKLENERLATFREWPFENSLCTSRKVHNRSLWFWCV